MGRRRSRGRDIDGVLLLDKPLGFSSNHALQQVKRLYAADKAGHTGSLDPLATGLLPLCFGEATKLSGFLLDADKGYRVTGRLGIKTITADSEGEVIATRDASQVSRELLLQAMTSFRGDIQQLPPMYSALKHQGQRLYNLARQGVEVERQPRAVRIDQFELIDFTWPDFTIDIRCTKGTYVRTLVDDLGDLLECGAYVTQLRRTLAGPFSEMADQFVTLEHLEQLRDEEQFAAMDALLIPMADVLRNWPELRLEQNSVFYLRQGQPVMVPKAPAEGWVRLFDQSQRFLGIGEIDDDGRVAPRRLIKSAG